MARGLARVVANTGLQGRWQVWSQAPMTILDTAHNPHGLRATMRQLLALPGGPLHIVLGMVQDKDVRSALACLPAEATYYFCAAQIPRAMPAEQLQALGESMGLQGAALSPCESSLGRRTSGSESGGPPLHWREHICRRRCAHGAALEPPANP